MMFGPTDNDSPNSQRAMRWKIKRESNDRLRQKFIDKTVAQAEFIGLTIPDPDLKWNEETQHYDFGEIDWKEFYEVIKGKGPCNKQRLETHVGAHEEGSWVRETAQEYSRLKKELNKELV